MLSDSHAHLDAPVFKDTLPTVINRARLAGVETIITIGVTPSSTFNCMKIASCFPDVYASAGYHPHWAKGADQDRLSYMERLIATPGILAVGEIGLDYHKQHSPRHDQIALFTTMLEMAAVAGKPVIIHDRHAHNDVYRILSAFRHRLVGGVIHCFSGDWQLARKYLDWNFFLSVPGWITYPTAHTLRDVVRRTPLTRLLIETDAPHLTPLSCKGSPNEPAFIRHTAKAISELLERSLMDIARTTSHNLRHIFKLPPAHKTSQPTGLKQE